MFCATGVASDTLSSLAYSYSLPFKHKRGYVLRAVYEQIHLWDKIEANDYSDYTTTMSITVNNEALVWQQALRDSVSKLDELLALLQLPAETQDLLVPAMKDFKLRVPRSFIARMRTGDPKDPLLLQVLPQLAEMNVVSGYSHDPLQEQHATAIPGLLHKYHGRVLLITAGSCAINCRYCFRRHFPYENHYLGRSAWPNIIQYLHAHEEVSEVILSGGEPLLLKDDYLADLVQQLEYVPHLRRLRIHTRLPIVIPARITQALVTLLNSTRLQVVMVLHCNHPQELNDELKMQCFKLKTPNIHLFNQAVLLGTINDHEATLAQLQYDLFDSGILPYYLHLLDPVQGAAHFAVPVPRAKALHQYLRMHLPGYLVPKLVMECAGEAAKSPL